VLVASPLIPGYEATASSNSCFTDYRI